MLAAELPDIGGDVEAAHIAPRREHNAFAPIRAGVVHAYGVDFLSNKEVLELFEQFQPQTVEWLDDSSCNVIFDENSTPAEPSSGAGATHSELDAVSRVLKEMSSGEVREEPWILTGLLSVGKGKQQSQQPGQQQRGKARRAVRDFRLQLRLATEADRKDAGHSGHTDSVYYAAVKEQQALQKQQVENRRAKKRQRQSRFPAHDSRTQQGEMVVDNGEASPAVGSSVAPRPPLAPSPFVVAGGADAAAGLSAAESTGVPKLGARGILDPLAFMRAAGNAGSPFLNVETVETEGGQRKNDDLKAALKRAEAEYASVLQPSAGAASGGIVEGQHASAADPGLGRGAATTRSDGIGKRSRDSAPGHVAGRLAQGRGSTSAAASAAALRGRKRRPTEQEPRAVSAAGPALRKVQAFPEVEAFLSTHHVRCQRYQLHRSFRSIQFGLQKQKEPKTPFGGKPVKDAQTANAAVDKNADISNQLPSQNAVATADVIIPDATKPVKAAAMETTVASKPEAQTADAKISPWEQYLKANHGFVRHGHFMHTVAWEAEGRRILTVIPHPTRVDLDAVAKAIQCPRGAIKQRKIKDISTDTGFPIFVCPPFGHPKDSQGRDPLLLVDSMITEFKKPLLFDCGSVGLSVPVSEFFKSTKAACIEGLGKVEASSPESAKIAVQTVEAKIVEAAARPASPEGSPEPAPEPGPAGSADIGTEAMEA